MRTILLTWNAFYIVELRQMFTFQQFYLHWMFPDIISYPNYSAQHFVCDTSPNSLCFIKFIKKTQPWASTQTIVVNTPTKSKRLLESRTF